MIDERTLDPSNPEHMQGLIDLYNAMRDHQVFWNRWLSDNLNPAFAEIFVAEDEAEASKALAEALINLTKLAGE